MLPHLYIIITILGQPVMTMRWANDDPVSCTDALHEQEKATNEAFSSPARLAKMREKYPTLTRDDIKTTCEMHTPATLPKIRDAVPLKP